MPTSSQEAVNRCSVAVAERFVMTSCAVATTEGLNGRSLSPCGRRSRARALGLLHVAVGSGVDVNRSSVLIARELLIIRSADGKV